MGACFSITRDTKTQPFPTGGEAPRHTTPPHSGGVRLGGSVVATDKRTAVLEAAEKRAAANASRGIGDKSRIAEMDNNAKRQELLGKITEWYLLTKKTDPPVGLRLASLDQLKAHMAALRSGKIDPE